MGNSSNLSAFWTFFLDKFRVTLLFAMLFFLTGLFAYQNIARESDPDVEIPIAVIQTVWPGSSAQDIENLVTEKIEREIKNLENLKKYTSVSLPSVSIVTVEYDTGTDLTQNYQKLREAIDDAERELPDDVPDSPNITEASVSSTPILTLSLSGDFAFSTLKQFAETLQEDFETIPGIKEVNISGVPDEKFHLYLDPVKLQGFGLSVEDISQRLQAAHTDIPVGNIFVTGEKIEIRVAGEFETIQDFQSFPISRSNGQTIRLAELGEVRREFDELETENLISTGEPAKRYVSIDLLKSKAKTNIIKVIDEAFERLEGYNEDQVFPDNLTVDIVFNGSDDIKESLNTLFSSGVQTIFLIGLILLLILGWRESLLAFISIPLTLLIAILILYITGETFNFLSLFALILALGLLVDNAIIMTEGISEGIYSDKLTPKGAARKALKTFRWPVIAGTSTTIFAFLPMMFVISGVSGEYVSVIPKTVTWVLLASLFVSLFILPTFGAKFFELFPPRAHKEGRLLHAAQDWYQEKMAWLLLKRRRFYGTIVLSVAVMIFSFALFAIGQISVEVFPSSDQNYFSVSVETPKGTKLEETRKLVTQIDQAFLPYFDKETNGDGEVWLKNYAISLGQKSPYDPELRQGGINTPEGNMIGITVNLIDKSYRDTSSIDISDRVREDLGSVMPDYVEVTVTELASGPPSGSSAIEVRLISENLSHIESLADDFQSKLAAIELPSGASLDNIIDDRGETLPQITWTIDHEKMQNFGLSAGQIFQTLRAGVEGVEILAVSEGEEEIELETRLDFLGDKRWTDPNSLDVLKQIPIKTPSGVYIRLDQVAKFSISNERTSLRHQDGKRTIKVGASIDGEATAAQFLISIETAISELDTLPGDSIVIGGDNEETNRLVSEMALAMLLAVFLILVILVLQFDSFLQAAVIVTLLPLSLTGVFLGFWLTGVPISFPTMIGIVALAGIIVNDAIVLIDQINHYGKFNDQIGSFIEAGKARMQPIVITSITTIFGLLPLAFSDPIWQGLSLAIIYGMTLATILTLLIVPCLILIYQDITHGVGWILTAKWLRRNENKPSQN